MGITTAGKQPAGLAAGNDPVWRSMAGFGGRARSSVIGTGSGEMDMLWAAAEWPSPVIVEHRRPMCVSR
jgi:hypothetical protein